MKSNMIRWTTLFLLSFCCYQLTHAQAADKPNVIFIIIDDLNDYTETLAGHPQAESPGIYRVEELGTTFLNAHASSPKCAPSRTSFVTGKDLYYTGVYNNPSCQPFRNYFTAGMGNEEVYTLPEYLKDVGGYFTYGINKIYHCFDSYPDLDTVTADACSKSLSWNKYSWFIDGEDTIVTGIGNTLRAGVKDMNWAVISDTLDPFRYDYRSVDSAVNFIHDYAGDPSIACDRPFFLMLGLRKPHTTWFIPEKYYSDDYLEDFEALPYNFPYNIPDNAYPYNGVVMPPQPDTIYNDFFHLPEGGLGQYVASVDSIYFNFLDRMELYTSMPVVDSSFSDEERYEVVLKSYEANAVLAYLAASKSVDAQVLRLLDSLEEYPEIYSNTIIVLVSDHGFSLGEKRHWLKGTMWETDLRVPFVIADLRNPVQQVNHNPVSLLDIFPTVCDLTDTPLPLFEDGTQYVDGISLFNQIQNSTLLIDKPSLAAYKEHNGSQCSCYPLYSVRNSDFHYIIYRSNGSEWDLDCDFANSWTEAELYEIGEERDVDPNEWNNLISDTSYNKVVDYLSQWLPDSAMYLRVPFTVLINNNPVSCLLDHDDTLLLSFEIYDTSGVLISPPENYIYEWSNDVTGELLYGTDAEFHMESVPDDIYDSGSRIMFIMQMIDTVSGTVVALDHKYYYFNPGNEPSVSFEITVSSHTVTISDIDIDGVVVQVNWDFGDGYLFTGFNPGTHYYTEPGVYDITCSAVYGNADTCIVEASTFVNIADAIFNPVQDMGVIRTWPIPADQTLWLEADGLTGKFQLLIYNISGQIVKAGELDFNGVNPSVDVGNLPQGSYLLRIFDDKESALATFEVAH